MTDFSLQTRALTANLSIGVWTGNKNDKEVTAEVQKEKKAEHGSGKYQKKLLHPESMKPIRAVVSAARYAHIHYTLPWEDYGPRILTNKAYANYTKEMHNFRVEFEAKVKRFLNEYDDHIRKASRWLGQMYDPDDYPSVLTLEKKFYFRVELDGIKDPNDFRVALGDKAIAEIKKDAREREQQKLQRAMQDVWKRVYDLIEHAVTKLKDYNPEDWNALSTEKRVVLRDSLIGNIKELTEMLPSLNITEDKTLTEMQERIKAEICVFNVEDLRTSKAERKKAIDRSEKILTKVKAYIA